MESLKGFKDRKGKFHPIRQKRIHKERRQIGIVTGGLALGTKAVAKGVASGVAKGAGKTVTSIGTPLAKGAGRGILSGLGSVTKSGAKIAGRAVLKDVKTEAKGQLGQCHPVSVNPNTGQVGGINLKGGGVKLDSCTLKAVALSKTTDIDTISSGLFGQGFSSLPPDKKAVALYLQQGNAKRG